RWGLGRASVPRARRRGTSRSPTSATSISRCGSCSHARVFSSTRRATSISSRRSWTRRTAADRRRAWKKGTPSPVAARWRRSSHSPDNMIRHYNELAGRRLDRIAALSDGVFAIAMTLIVLEIRVPDAGPVRSEQDLWNAMLTLGPRLVTYLLSFLTLGIFWSAQQTQLNLFATADRDLSWLQLAFLATVALMPFSTSLLADFITFRLALVAYWANILLLGVIVYLSL